MEGETMKLWTLSACDRDHVRHPHGEGCYSPVTDADLRKLGYVRLFKTCGCTDAYMLGPKEDGYPVTGELPPDPDCPSCGGSGETPRDGVSFESERYWTVTADDQVVFAVEDPPWGRGGKMGNDPRLAYPTKVRVFVIPASMLEGDKTND
jgi:hypothetical protein